MNNCIAGVTEDLLVQIWPSVAPLLDRPLKRMKLDRKYATHHIYEKLCSNDLQLWVAFDKQQIECVFVTRICVYPTGWKTFDIWLVGGEKISHWFESAWDLFKEYAKHHKCDSIKGGGRVAWPKVLSKIEDREFEMNNSFEMIIGDTHG